MNYSSIFFASGFGLNFNLFETNIINLAVVVFGLYKFLPNFLGSMLERRRSVILSDLKDAEERLDTANLALTEAKKELAAAEKKAEQIRKDCKARAEAIRLETEKRTVEEMARIKQGSASDLNAEAARLSSQLRQEAARLAIEKALGSLPKRLDQKAQENFVSQSIKNLGDA